jgi:pterin-4a-carbinolamine dehydratase
MNSRFMVKKYFCEMLGNFISRKSGQKCCVYGQNGKPLSPDAVKKFLDNLQSNLEYEVKNSKEIESLTEFQKSRKLITWVANDDYTRLFRLFHFKNVFLLTDLIKEIYHLDFKSNTQQVPNISISNQDLFKIELYTPALKGLSFRDFQLAVAINSINFQKYKMIPLKDEKTYKREIRLLNIEEERAKNELGEGVITDRTKLKNKYDGLIYEQALMMENENLESNTGGCSNPGGCACKDKTLNSKYI